MTNSENNYQPYVAPDFEGAPPSQFTFDGVVPKRFIPAAERLRHSRHLRRKVGATLLATLAGIFVFGKICYEVGQSHPEDSAVVAANPAPVRPAPAPEPAERPVPTASDIADMKSRTEAACAIGKDVLPPDVTTVPNTRKIVTSNTDRIVVVGNGDDVTIAKGVRVGEAFFCDTRGSLNVIGDVGFLGITADDSFVSVSGSVDQVWMNNNYNNGYAGSSRLRISGTVGDIVNRSSGGDGEDVIVTGKGRVENYLENDSGREIWWDIDTRLDGEVENKEEY